MSTNTCQQHSKPFNIWSAIIRITTEGKSLIMKSSPDLLLFVFQNCELLIKTVEDTGVIMREIRELEDQVTNKLMRIQSIC